MGSGAPVQCPPGRNSSSTGLVNVTDCPLCAETYYCPLNGTVYATRKCDAGSFCPSGSKDVSNLCPTGSSCPSGSARPVICDAGTYQDEIGQASCKVKKKHKNNMYDLSNHDSIG
jgi:hypothetical protein